MTKPTTEELQAELQTAVNQRDQAKQLVNQTNVRIIEIQAILKDRQEDIVS
jgi:hypothetical protein